MLGPPAPFFGRVCKEFFRHFLTYSNIFALCLLNQTRTALFSGKVFSFVLFCEYLPFRHHFFLYKFKKSYGNRKYIFLCYFKFSACSKTLAQKNSTQLISTKARRTKVKTLVVRRLKMKEGA